jgi:hypothetical protein
MVPKDVQVLPVEEVPVVVPGFVPDDAAVPRAPHERVCLTWRSADEHPRPRGIDS